MNRRVNKKGSKQTIIPITPMYSQKKKFDIREEVVKQLKKDSRKVMDKDLKQLLEENESEEVHYTTITKMYDYSDGLSFSEIEGFRTKFPVGTKVEVVVRKRKAK